MNLLHFVAQVSELERKEHLCIPGGNSVVFPGKRRFLNQKKDKEYTKKILVWDSVVDSQFELLEGSGWTMEAMSLVQKVGKDSNIRGAI